MNHNGKHHVKKHHWYNGILHTTEHFFDTVEEAIDHANTGNAHSVKVYSPTGELVHSLNLVAENTYA